MKNFLKVTILAAGLVICLNASSFAQVDVAVYGGYVFSGTVEVTEEGLPSYDVDFSATQFGIKGHYNIEMSPAVTLGLGVFYQSEKVDPDDWGGGSKPKRTSLGADVAFLFSMDSAAVFPYVRLYCAYDKLKIWGESAPGVGFGIGGGLEYAINTNIRLFGELMYEAAAWEKDIDWGYGYEENLKANASQIGLNVGLKFVF